MPDLPHSILDDARRLGAVEAAVGDLRRGMPAIVGDQPPGLALLSVETADEAGLASLGRVAAEPPRMLLSAARASVLLPGLLPDSPVVALAAAAVGLDELRGWADPTYRTSSGGTVPRLTALPEAAEAGLALAVLSRLLPAVLCAPALHRVGPPASDVLRHASLTAGVLQRVSEAVVPLEDAPDARLIAFRATYTGAEHYAVLVGRPEEQPSPLVRVHSDCFTGDLLGSLRCDCGPQLRGAISRMASEGAGALLYMAQEGRGIGLPNKLRAYTLQDRGLDTVDANRVLGFAADERDFQAAAAMLRQLGLTRIRLLTNNPDKIATLASHGVEVAGRESLLFAANGVNDRYLRTKVTRFGHLPD